MQNSLNKKQEQKGMAINMKIAQVSKEYDISADTLRYYERIGLIPSVTRTSSGIRDYSEDDCRWVEFAKCMRSSGIPVEAIIEYIALYKQGDSTAQARKQILIEERQSLVDRIEKMQKALTRLNGKIEHYDQLLDDKPKF